MTPKRTKPTKRAHSRNSAKGSPRAARRPSELPAWRRIVTRWSENPFVPLAVFGVTRALELLDLASSDETIQRLLVLDARRYFDAATQIAAGVSPSGSEPFQFAPLYPYFLAALLALGGGLWTLYLVQLCIAGLNAWLLYRIGRAIFGLRTAVVGVTLWSLYAPAGMLELKLVESTVATLFSLLAVFALLPGRGGRLVPVASAGVALGLACLTRPNLLLLAPLLSLWVLSRGAWRARLPAPAGWARAGVFALGVALAIAPATLRNHALSGQWVLISAQGGITFYQGNNPRSDGSYSLVPGFSGDPEKQPAEAARLAGAAQGSALSAPEVDAYWFGRGLSYLSSDWPGAVALWGRKLFAWFGSAEVAMEYVLPGDRSLHPSLWLLPVPFGVLLGGAVLGLRRRLLVGKAALLTLVLLTNLAATLIFFFASRYRVPAVPALCLLAADGFVRFARTARLPRWLLAGGAALLSLFPWSTAIERQTAQYFYVVANQYFQAGERDKAISFYERAARGLTSDWASHHNLGEAYGSVGRYQAAVDALEQARRLDPGRASTRRALEYYKEQLAGRSPSR